MKKILVFMILVLLLSVTACSEDKFNNGEYYSDALKKVESITFYPSGDCIYDDKVYEFNEKRNRIILKNEYEKIEFIKKEDRYVRQLDKEKITIYEKKGEATKSRDKKIKKLTNKYIRELQGNWKGTKSKFVIKNNYITVTSGDNETSYELSFNLPEQICFAQDNVIIKKTKFRIAEDKLFFIAENKEIMEFIKEKSQ